MIDIKKKIEEIVNKIKNDKSLTTRLKNDPVRTIKSLLGVDIPEDMVEKVIDGVKATFAAEKQAGYWAR